jgi:hypothetical protein
VPFLQAFRERHPKVNLIVMDRRERNNTHLTGFLRSLGPVN